MRLKRACLATALCILLTSPAAAEHSAAREWNEALLFAIRTDFARPTVHARNLFHTSFAMYDAWAAYDDRAQTYLLGKNVHGFNSPFYGVPRPADVNAARGEAISYAMYRILRHRFKHSPGRTRSYAVFDSVMNRLGYDASYVSTDYASGVPAALGNYIAEQVIAYGLQDNSNEVNRYSNRYYEPVNPPLVPTQLGNPTLVDPNRWQPLTLDFIDQSGNPFPRSTPPFLSPEWGQVHPFALTPADLTIYPRGGFDYWVYHDPGAPPQLDTLAVGGESEDYKWNFEIVSAWSSHLDPYDGVMWDISPASLGNSGPLPTTSAEYRAFYDMVEGGNTEFGHALNPRTGQPYTPQVVPRGDYTRVLAEFWADGPESETPPGHWFTILNYVTDHPQFEARFKGTGPVLDPLEWDVKAYFTLGGAVHDAAVTAWGIKGHYDYIRPVSAIRWMCLKGQSSNPAGSRYFPGGIHLVPNLIEMVEPGDPLAGAANQHVGKVKVRAWRGPYHVVDPDTSTAGVSWILADEWWPYQRPTFVSPPFAGYISGHSTFSRSAAEVMTLLTGDEFFPGGMGEFHAPRNEFLVFEDGPSVDLTLQWATYRDASDQTSLSRIWGGIHPPVDDIPGRKIGMVIGPAAFALAEQYFNGTVAPSPVASRARLFPNPIGAGVDLTIEVDQPGRDFTMKLFNVQGRLVREQKMAFGQNQRFGRLNLGGVENGIYFMQLTAPGWEATQKLAIVR